MKTLTESEKRMIQSCYTYGMTWLDEKLDENLYLQDIVARVGMRKVKAELKRLSDTYDVIYNTGQDSEGVTYNSLRARTTQ